ncbi:MAG: acyl-ACP--UDP-N-acetylglucosamine O-acyltransferase [Syntrophobacteraceae bacterium]
MEIHPTAVVSREAKLADDVTIKAYCVIGPEVEIGSGTVVEPHVVIEGLTTIGADNRIYPFSAIGYPPQDLTYRGEETRVIIGDGNTIRENVTIHRGTERGGGITRIGSNNYLMAYVHIAHDCRLGDGIVMANVATLAGHVHIEDRANIGGLVAIHQFARIGSHAFIGGKAGVSMDVPPFMLATGNPAKLYGPNMVGLRRSGFSTKAIQALKKSYKILFRSGLPLTARIEKVREEVEAFPEVEMLLQFMIESSKRGFTR